MMAMTVDLVTARVSELTEKYPHEVNVVLKIRWGSPEQIIVSVSDELKPALVVVGSHGRGHLKRYV